MKQLGLLLTVDGDAGPRLACEMRSSKRLDEGLSLLFTVRVEDHLALYVVHKVWLHNLNTMFVISTT